MIRVISLHESLISGQHLGARVSLAGAAYESPSARIALIDRVTGRLADLPGVTAVTATSHVPLIDRQIGSARFLVDPALPPEGQPLAYMRFVGSDYLETMRIQTIRGRAFTNAEARDVKAAIAMVNQTMAQRYWAEGEAASTRDATACINCRGCSPAGGSWT